MTSFQRPSRIHNPSSTPLAADATVCFCYLRRAPHYGVSFPFRAGENFGADPFARDAGTLRGHSGRGPVRQIAHRLPADGGVRIEQPIERIHAAMLL
jgi:hypothetical protein